jgi:oxygen-independent coproporphyrinogen-3 oxidase
MHHDDPAQGNPGASGNPARIRELIAASPLDCRKPGSQPEGAGFPAARDSAGGEGPSGVRFRSQIRSSSFGHAPCGTRGMSTSDMTALIERYDRPGPRYTSYPTAVEFHNGFTAPDYAARLAEAARVDAPLSLYLHVPFCESRCAYCGCAAIATRTREVAATYVDYLERELAMLAAALGPRRRVVQYHWGGGTPTYLSPEQIARLDGGIRRLFEIAPDAEQAIEIDPRVTTPQQIRVLRRLGFNRLSFGVQDFDKDVQRAILRRQTEEETRNLYRIARDAGFESINFDLIYGLPLQTVESFGSTLASVVDLRPDRIAVYSYAHVPWIRPNQKAIDPLDLPDASTKRRLLAAAIETFTAAGYVSIGMDHFALPDDELAAAARERRLHRNFMGYTVRPAPDSVGVGVSAIGDVAGAFSQNHKSLARYYEAIDAGCFPVERGYALTGDDKIRRYVIGELMCNFHVDDVDLGQRFGVTLDDYFAEELSALLRPGGAAADGLVRVADGGLTVTPLGRLFVRNVCMVFDRYLASHEGRPTFSRTV